MLQYTYKISQESLTLCEGRVKQIGPSFSILYELCLAGFCALCGSPPCESVKSSAGYYSFATVPDYVINSDGSMSWQFEITPLINASCVVCNYCTPSSITTKVTVWDIFD